MYRLRVPAGIDRTVPVQYGRPLESGKSYIVTGRFAGSLLLSMWRCKIDGLDVPIRTRLKIDSWSGIKPFLGENADWNKRDLWLCRGGGYGDLLAMTPLIREINTRWPQCRLHVACGIQFFDLFHGLDVIPELLPIPFDPLIALIDFEELVEGSPNAVDVHITQLFAFRAGIQLHNVKMHYQVQPIEEAFAESDYPRTDKKRIAIQLFASALYRSYPKMQFVVKELMEEHEVFIFGVPGQVEVMEHPNLINLMADKLTFRQSAAVLATCDVCVAPDSALVHLCAALDIPCVALYGPIPSALRISGHNVYPIDGKAPCAPCFFHADKATDFPEWGPCKEVNKCVALDSIPVEDVVKKVKSLLCATD